jgi:tetratricopeptide (TPR) repeat protein
VVPQLVEQEARALREPPEVGEVRLADGLEEDRLDQVLVDSRLITAEQLAEAERQRGRSGQLLGQVLRQLGLVDDQQLDRALRWQLQRKVTRLFSARGSVDVSPTDHPFGVDASSPGMSIEPRRLMFPGILNGYDDVLLRAELEALSGRVVRLVSVGVGQLSELGFRSHHGPLLSHLQQTGFRIERNWLDSDAGARGREARSILLALFYLDLLGFPEEARETTPVAPSAPADAPAVPRPAPALDCAQLYLLGERSFRNGDLVRAEQSFEQASQGDPHNPRLRAFLIWIHFSKQDQARRQAMLERTLAALREIVRKDREFAHGHYFLGKLLKLGNDLRRAELAFRSAIQHDDQLIDAQRELRLMHMRRAG